MSAFLHLYLASLKEFSRDRMAMFWTMAFPVFFILIFGVVFSGNSDTTFNVGLAVEDQGPVGVGLGKALGSVSAFKVTEGPRADLMEKVKKGDLRALIVIPEGVSGAVTSGKPSNVEVHYDPSSQTTSQVVLTIVEKVVDAFDRQVTRTPTLMTVNRVTVTSSALRNIDFLLPGILAMSLMQLGLFATAPELVQLREQQVLRRIGATPLPRTTLFAAQVVHRISIGILQTFVIILVGWLVFQVQILGSVALLAGFVVVGALMFVAMGYFLSSLARTQESVIGISQFINFPMMFLSGIFFPVDFMPDWVRPVVTAMPLTYLADALRQIMVGAPPINPLATDFVVLSAWLVACSVLAVRFFRWE